MKTDNTEFKLIVKISISNVVDVTFNLLTAAPVVVTAKI